MKRIEKFENQQRVCREVEILVISHDLSYIEAAVLYANTNNLEIDYVAELLGKNDVFRSRIEEEAESLNCLKKKPRLPF